ncbi:5'-nucleotidase domain-containing protein 1 [Trichomycterus rosablanca]|uniref:5'-nucleotidase domain-containing protein 1 n=1 Tax=Trichomycterus rosablanca TaxID=2290929 RepID=UPI002F351C38
MSGSLSLSECDVIGFDLDHTLCRYQLKNTSMLIYESFARYLVENKGYDEDLLNVPPDMWDLCSKGLVVDLEKGNLLKLSHDGTILRATHGSRNLSEEEIIKQYGPKREWKHFNNLNTTFNRSADYYFCDNYFDLPGVLLCALVVDLLQKRGSEDTAQFWTDIIEAMDYNYSPSAFREGRGWYFPNVKRDPGRYLQICPEAVRRWLKTLKENNKILLLITSSHSDYCSLVCEFVLGKDYKDLFDVIVTNALKPGFFSLKPQQRLFKTLMGDVESSEGLVCLEKPGWFSQGNWIHLRQLIRSLTNKQEPKMVYFGDSMRSDIFPACKFGKLETVMILEEMEGEGVATENDKSITSNQHTNQSPAEKKAKCEEGCIRSPSAVSQQWGSYFLDVQRDERGEERPTLTWSCNSVHQYCTIAVPSIECITELPLDYKFTSFSADSSVAGYYPSPPHSLLRGVQS